MREYPAVPISLYVQDRRVVVVGDGKQAHERAQRMRDAGADLVHLSVAEYSSERLQGAVLAVGNDDDDSVNLRVLEDAKAAGILAYAHDQPDRSDLAMPALIKRGPLKLAISTDAVAPALSRRLREQLSAMFDEVADKLEALIERLRHERATSEPGKRGHLYELASSLRIDGHIVIDEEAHKES